MALEFKNPKQVCNNLDALRQVKEYKQSDCGMTKHFESVLGESYKDEQGPSPGFIQVQEEAKHWSEQKVKEINNSEEMKKNREYKDIAGDPDLIERAKDLIVDRITKHLDDVLFEMVCEQMGDNYMFQSKNYLTEAGYEMFEDEWFEFYHEHHGDILYQIKENITNG